MILGFYLARCRSKLTSPELGVDGIQILIDHAWTHYEGQSHCRWKNPTPADVFSYLRPGSNVREEDIMLLSVSIDHTAGTTNPLRNVKFFDRYSDETAEHLEPRHMSGFHYECYAVSNHLYHSFVFNSCPWKLSQMMCLHSSCLLILLFPGYIHISLLTSNTFAICQHHRQS